LIDKSDDERQSCEKRKRIFVHPSKRTMPPHEKMTTDSTTAELEHSKTWRESSNKELDTDIPKSQDSADSTESADDDNTEVNNGASMALEGSSSADDVLQGVVTAESSTEIVPDQTATDSSQQETQMTPQSASFWGFGHLQALMTNEPAAAADAGPQPGSAEHQALRASCISMTVVRTTKEAKWGIGFKQEQELNGDGVVTVAALTNDGLLAGAPFQVGDKLISVNGKPCVSSNATTQQLLDVVGQVTLVAEIPGGNSRLVQATVIKPTPDSQVGLGFQNVKKSNTNLLLISHVSPQGLFARSSMNEGDLVLTINSTFCGKMLDPQAAALVKDATDVVTIVVMKPQMETEQAVAVDPNAPLPTRRQRILRGARKAGVAVGGGLMVGVGLVFIPTLPPPFGEVLILGGVSALSTEFEGPKRVMRSARDSVARAVGPGEEGAAAATADDASVVAGTETTASSQDGGEQTASAAVAAKPKKTMGSRFKNFGRIHVLPFMDQVVGDKKEQAEQGSTATVTAEVPSPPIPIEVGVSGVISESASAQEGDNAQESTAPQETLAEETGTSEVVLAVNNGDALVANNETGEEDVVVVVYDDAEEPKMVEEDAKE
jgi:hypothetical protein